MILEIAATLPLRCGGVLGLFSALASNLPTVDKHAAAIDGTVIPCSWRVSR